MEVTQIVYLEVKEDKKKEEIIQKVIQKCFETEKMSDSHLYVSITLTTPAEIQKINKDFRNIDKPTDVLSFPMFEKEELGTVIVDKIEDVLGDIVISIQQVEKQAQEFGHSVERELAYMVVHGFYHLMGYDHETESDKQEMRVKEEAILTALQMNRE